LSTGQKRREESQKHSQEEEKTYPQQEIRHSLEMWESYSQRNNAGISPGLKKSNSRYWKRPNFETSTKEKYRKPVKATTKSRTTKETWTKEEKK